MMRMFAPVAAVVLSGAAAAIAQPAPSPTSAPPPTVTATPVPARLTLDSPITALLADARARALVTAAVGQDLSTHPEYSVFQAMSLREVQPISEGQLTDAMMRQIETGLAALP